MLQYSEENCRNLGMWWEQTISAPPSFTVVLQAQGNVEDHEDAILGSESSQELSFLGAKVPSVNFRSRSENTAERKVPEPMLAVVRQSQKILARRKPPSWGPRMAKI